MFALALALLLSAPAASVQAASSVNKKLAKQVNGIVKKKVKAKDSKKRSCRSCFNIRRRHINMAAPMVLSLRKGGRKTTR